MRALLSWLEEWVPLPPDDALVDRLSLGGFEDVALERIGPDLSAIRVGRVLAREPHPQADRLSVCRVEVEAGETLAVVCGAPNVAAGQKVAVALPGTSLPDGTKLKRAKIRGVVSNGMICSRRELGLGDDHEGILVLDPDAPVGAPLPSVLRTGDRVLEVGITPNRGDAASLLGLAREVRALFGGALTLPELRAPGTGPAASRDVSVEIEAPDACHRYVARVVRGVRVGPSPDWLRQRLEASGIRAINGVVDVTNLVLLELGQPLHAFDLAGLAGGRVRVRWAQPGEKLAMLDGQTRALDPRDLVIADAERPVALAGVMGGADSEVGASTVDVLIESAHFEPGGVRMSARRHGLRTEASYRFERGVDRLGVGRSAERAARLIAELAGGEVGEGAVEAVGDAPAVTDEIRFDVARANRLLGLDLGADEAAALLERVEVGCRERAPGVLTCSIPSHRNDLHLPEDLAEEVARIHGYDRIPTTEPVGVLSGVERPESWVRAERARDALAACGLIEVMCFPFVPEGDAERLRLAPDDPRRRALRVQNPVRDEEPELRTHLLPCLLRLARQNRSRQLETARLFEVSRVFRARGAGEPPDEPLWLAALLVGHREAGPWSARGEPAPLFFEARGIAERLLDQLGYVACWPGGAAPPYLHPGAAVAIEIGGEVVGAVGELHPEVAAGFEIDAPAALVELALGALEGLSAREARYREVSRHPQVRRDLAVVVDRAQPAGEVLAAVRRAAGRDLLSAQLFDRYEGRGVARGRVSLAFRLVFQRSDRTLTDTEVTRATDRVVRTLAERFGAELRQAES